MRLFRRKLRQHPKSPIPAVTPPSSPNNQAVIAHYSLSAEPFGGLGESEAFFALEDSLIEAIESAGVGEYDGNEFGAGEAVAYMYGPDADLLFATVENQLPHFAARPAYCVLRYGDVSNPDARKRRIDL